MQQVKTASLLFSVKCDSFPCNRQERKTALSGMRVKGHGKSKDGRVLCRHPSERAGNNPTFLTHPGNIVWKRKAGKMWLSNDPSYIFYYAILNWQWQSERWQQTIEWRRGCGIRKWPRQTLVSSCPHISASMQCMREYATPAARPHADLRASLNANCGPCSNRFSDIFCLHKYLLHVPAILYKILLY